MIQIELDLTSGGSRIFQTRGAPIGAGGDSPIIWHNFCCELHEKARGRTFLLAPRSATVDVNITSQFVAQDILQNELNDLLFVYCARASN